MEDIEVMSSIHAEIQSLDAIPRGKRGLKRHRQVSNCCTSDGIKFWSSTSILNLEMSSAFRETMSYSSKCSISQTCAVCPPDWRRACLTLNLLLWVMQVNSINVCVCVSGLQNASWLEMLIDRRYAGRLSSCDLVLFAWGDESADLAAD